MTQIEELCENPTSEVSHDQIQNIVMFLSRSDSLAKHVDSFIKMLSLLQLKESTPLLLAPVLIGDLSEVDSMRYLFWRSSFLTISTLLINSCLDYCLVWLLSGNSFFFFLFSYFICNFPAGIRISSLNALKMTLRLF